MIIQAQEQLPVYTVYTVYLKVNTTIFHGHIYIPYINLIDILYSLFVYFNLEYLLYIGLYIERHYLQYFPTSLILFITFIEWLSKQRMLPPG